ncbi:MAG: pilus assembly protein PilX [Eubacterium sp.]|nr:pilus assembly protein PilX [Eubacterium sp.]MBQ9022841.1 pilus assembly protein PilX [Eubacterium sp.]
MRKWNALISMGIIVLFLIHAITGGLQLAGIIGGGNPVLKVLAWIMLVMIAAHVVIGIKLTADSLLACKKAGVSYFKENKLFWTRRISGFATIIFVLLHVILFMGNTSAGAYRLNLFATPQLVVMIFFVVSVAVHVLTNIKPLMIALGQKGLKEFVTDILLVISAFLIFSGIAFVIYYIRWL